MKAKVLYPIVAMVLALALASTACALGAQPEPTATVTPVPPTATPVPPTATPVPPTDTPVPPTATPDLAATAAAEATAQAALVVADIQAFLTKMDLKTDGELGWYQDEPISVDLDGYQDWQFLPFAEGLEAKDFILKTDITWESSGWPTCGVMFRSDPSYVDYYWLRFLRLSGLPGWDIEYYKDDNYIFAPTGGDLRFSDKLDQGNGATNVIVLVVEGNKFVLYINGQRQGQFFDNKQSLTKGYFAFAAWHESGTTTCTHTNTWIWLLP